MKKRFIIIFSIFLLLFIFITIQPAPLIGEDSFIIYPSSIGRPLSDFLPMIFSLNGITTYDAAGAGVYHIFYTFYSLIGGQNVWHFKLLNLSILAINYLFLWLWFKKTDEQVSSLWPLSAIVFFTFSIPVWQMVVAHSSSPGTTQTLFTAIALFTYFFYYRLPQTKVKQILSFIIILFFTRVSTLMKGEGRLIFVIIFIYLFILTGYTMFKGIKINKKIPSLKSLPLFETKNMILLFILFILCIPLISFLITIESETGPIQHYVQKTDVLYTYFPILFSLRPGLGEGFIHTNYGFYYHLFLKTLYPWHVYSFFAVFIICISLLLMYISLKHTRESTIHTTLAHLCLFSGIWFIIVLSAIEVQRGLTEVHSYYNWQIIDLYYAFFPGSIFIISCVWFAYLSLSELDKKKVLRRILIFLLILLLIIKITTMLTWSGGFLDYFVGFFHASDYVSEHDNTSRVVVFHQGTNYIYSDLTLIKYHFPTLMSKENSCPTQEQIDDLFTDYNPSEDMFILTNEPLQSCEKIVFIDAITPRNTSFYYYIKNILRLSKKTYIYQITD